jgi:hypothetical protein
MSAPETRMSVAARMQRYYMPGGLTTGEEA